MVLGIVKAFLEKLGIGIGVKKVVLLMSGSHTNMHCLQWTKGREERGWKLLYAL